MTSAMDLVCKGLRSFVEMIEECERGCGPNNQVSGPVVPWNRRVRNQDSYSSQFNPNPQVFEGG
jgi:hypothetical protein